VRTIRCPIHLGVAPDASYDPILRLSIEADWSELHIFANITWQTAGSDLGAAGGAVLWDKSALEAR
jgi:hypothetical protein